MKICTICKNEKDGTCFSSNGAKYKKSACKDCRKEISKEKRRKCKRTYIKSKYSNMKQRVYGKTPHKRSSLGKDIVPFDVFYEFTINNNEFNKLFDLWVSSGFDMQVSPSIDRVDIKKGYTLDNMQYIKFKENSVKDRRKKTIIKNNKKVVEFNSRSDAAEFLGVTSSRLSLFFAGKISNIKGWELTE